MIIQQVYADSVPNECEMKTIMKCTPADVLEESAAARCAARPGTSRQEQVRVLSLVEGLQEFHDGLGNRLVLVATVGEANR